MPPRRGELHATLDALGARASGPAGGIYAGELFTDEHGQATVFVPTATEIPRLGRVEPLAVPATELAVTVHPGLLADVDRAYGALAAYVANHALQVDGQSGSTTWSAARTPPTRRRGGPRSAGPSSAPGRPPEQATIR